jgi:sigma-E factor negative regulatory protein RseA
MKPEPQSRPAGATPEDGQAGEPRLWLSALADGDPQAAQQACAAWRDDAEARRAWHSYHLIGDVLRSDELARAPTHDAAFLDGLRARLAQEPIVLAPAAPQRGPRWLLPMAAAAGFVAVAGVLVVVRLGSPEGPAGASTLAAASRPGATATVTATTTAAGGAVLRDARLDEFLRAHQAARGGVAVAAPGGTLRRVDSVVPAGPER